MGRPGLGERRARAEDLARVGVGRVKASIASIQLHSAPHELMKATLHPHDCRGKATEKVHLRFLPCLKEACFPTYQRLRPTSSIIRHKHILQYTWRTVTEG